MLSMSAPAWNTPYTNYFYYFDHASVKYVGLVVEDTEELRALADECGVADIIYWGTNSDPVYNASVSKIIQLAHVNGFTGAFVTKCPGHGVTTF